MTKRKKYNYSNMAQSFELKKGKIPSEQEVQEFGAHIKIILRELDKSISFADKYFYKRRDEYIVLTGIREQLKEYQNQMDNNPVTVMMGEENKTDYIKLNNVFYG